MNAPMANVEGRTAFVTGGASGIGLGIARALVNAGANVVIADIREDSLAAASSLGAPDRVMTLQLDVTDRDGFVRAADAAEARFGNTHILVGNAGIGILGPILQTSYQDWDWGLNINLNGVINGLVTFLKRIDAHGEGGQIVSTASMAAVVPIPNASIYIAAKAAVLALSETIRGELAPRNIGVSAFCPGPVESNLGRTTAQLRAAAGGPAPSAPPPPPRAGSFNILQMDADECGRRVLEGIRRNDLYIFTHREFREGTATRMEAMVASYPTSPEDEARKGANSFLTGNPIFEEAIAAMRGR